MFVPNLFGLLSRRSAKNGYGEYSYAPAIKVACAIVHDKRKNQKTPVRSDSSADRGASEEKVAMAKILFPKTVPVAENDKFEINGMVLRVEAVEPRMSVLGELDHYEADMGKHS